VGSKGRKCREKGAGRVGPGWRCSGFGFGNHSAIVRQAVEIMCKAAGEK
jgi:hypothetical protein